MSGQGIPSQLQNLTPASMQQLADRLKSLVNEAKRIGVDTNEGKELLRQAARIKALYEAYNKQRQQQVQQAQQAQQVQGGASNAAISRPADQQNQQQQQQQQQQSGSNSVTSNIKMLLTPSQRDTYNRLVQRYEDDGQNIKGEFNFLKRNISVLDQEIRNRQDNPESVKQLEVNKNELAQKLRALSTQYTTLQQKYQEDRRKFYIECSQTNADLRRYLQAQQQKVNAAKVTQGAAMSAAMPASQPTVPPSVPNSGSSIPNNANNANSLNANSTKLAENTPRQNIPIQKAPVASSPAANPAPQDKSSPTQVTAVNAAANQSSQSSARAPIFKQPNPSIPISETVTPTPTVSVVYRSNRPTITGGSGMNAPALTTPVMTKLPPYEVDTERVMSKRKLRELVKTVGIDEGDGETTIDGDVEELLLDLADDFITNVTNFACKLSKHRKSDSLDVRDIQMHLERNWNIRIPGFASDEIRSTKKWNATPSYNQMVQAINNNKVSKAHPEKK